MQQRDGLLDNLLGLVADFRIGVVADGVRNDGNRIAWQTYELSHHPRG